MAVRRAPLGDRMVAHPEDGAGMAVPPAESEWVFSNSGQPILVSIQSIQSWHPIDDYLPTEFLSPS